MTDVDTDGTGRSPDCAGHHHQDCAGDRCICPCHPRPRKDGWTPAELDLTARKARAAADGYRRYVD